MHDSKRIKRCVIKEYNTKAQSMNFETVLLRKKNLTPIIEALLAIADIKNGQRILDAGTV